MPLDKLRHIRDPGYSFPKILRAVDTKRGQQILRRKRQHFVPGHHHLNHPLAQTGRYPGQSENVAASIPYGVRQPLGAFHRDSCIPPAPAPFSNPSTESTEIAPDSRVPASPRALSANRAAADDVEVVEVTQRQVPVGLLRKNGPFVRNRHDPGRSKQFENLVQFRR